MSAAGWGDVATELLVGEIGALRAELQDAISARILAEEERDELARDLDDARHRIAELHGLYRRETAAAAAARDALAICKAQVSAIRGQL